jgi:hypothetical protein
MCCVAFLPVQLNLVFWWAMMSEVRASFPNDPYDITGCIRSSSGELRKQARNTTDRESLPRSFISSWDIKRSSSS